MAVHPSHVSAQHHCPWVGALCTGPAREWGAGEQRPSKLAAAHGVGGEAATCLSGVGWSSASPVGAIPSPALGTFWASRMPVVCPLASPNRRCTRMGSSQRNLCFLSSGFFTHLPVRWETGAGSWAHWSGGWSEGPCTTCSESLNGRIRAWEQVRPAPAPGHDANSSGRSLLLVG